MKPFIRLKHGVTIALIVLMGLTAYASVVLYSIREQRQALLEQNTVARQISRFSVRILVLTHNVADYSTDSYFRQWWVVHENISNELEHLKFFGSEDDLLTRLEERLGDLAVLLAEFSELKPLGNSALQERRNSVLVDRLISESEQLAEISYKLADRTLAQHESLIQKSRNLLLLFVLVFALNSFLLLLLIRFKVVRPLGKIERTAKEMRRGNLAARCALPEGNELGDVAAALDKLAIELDNKLVDLKSTTQLLEVAGRMSGVGAWTLNLSTKALTWSKQIYDIVEADFTHQPSLDEVMSLYPEGSAEQLTKSIEVALRTGHDLSIELQLRTYKGNLIWAHVFGELTFEGEGADRKAVMIQGAFQDITERRCVEAEIRHARDAAESASKAKGDFLSNISHEIRTPLNAVVGLAYILKQSKLDSSQLEFVEKLENAGRGLVDLVTGVLDVSKIEAGAMELEERPFSARHLLDSLADLMTGALKDKPVEFVVAVAPHVPDNLIGDETKLRQVLVNLAGNSIKFTDKGHIKVSLTLDHLQGSSCVLRFVVQDTGLGMDTAAMNRLFQSFSQADSSISRRFGGSGIGLALSQKLVELMGGTISAVSAPGQGSLFSFSLMLNIDQNAQKAPQLHNFGCDVVLVDSFKTQRDSLTQMTQWWGVDPEVFDDENQALSLPASERPRLFVVNNQLNEMTGLEFAKKIREQHGPRKARIALMIAPKKVELFQEALNAGYLDALLVKPVSFAALKNTLLDLSGEQVGSSPTKGRELIQQELLFLSGLTVLAVDDHKLNLLILKKILETHGARVILAESGKAAITVLSEPNHSDVDVCLMDVQMPDMDGMETCEFIRYQMGMKRLPILALTAGIMQAEHQLAMDAGMNEVLTKPLHIDKVLDAVKRWGFQTDNALLP